MLKKVLLSLLTLSLLAFLCRAGYLWLLHAAQEPPASAVMDIEHNETVDMPPKTPPAPPATPTDYRRLARSELANERPGFETCLRENAKDLEVLANDPIVLDLTIRNSPTGSGRALVLLKRMHSIPEALDVWLKTGRHKGQPQPDWQPRPDLVPPDCLARLLARLDLPPTPEETVSLSWALPSLQTLGVVPGAVPSP